MKPNELFCNTSKINILTLRDDQPRPRAKTHSVTWWPPGEHWFVEIG